MTQIDYGLFDAANHSYEPADSFTRHIESRFKDSVVHAEIGSDGQQHVIIGGKLAPFFEVVKPPDSRNGWAAQGRARRCSTR